MQFVTKRSGVKEVVEFDKIVKRINKLINPDELKNLNLSFLNISKEELHLNPILVAQKVIATLCVDIKTEELDIQSANICADLSTTHPSYSLLGGRILISNLHKKTLNNFSDKMQLLNIIDNNFLEYVLDNKNELNNMIDYNRDYIYDFFGVKTLERSYLLKNNGITVERPQDMWLRTAITVQKGNLEMIKKTYDLMSLGCYTHASPTLYNSGTKHMQAASCFLIGIEDNLDNIMDTVKACAQISKWSGGIGLHMSNIRGNNSLIKGTGGKTDGIIPALRVFNDLLRYVNQGGKRPGSLAAFLEPHHIDIFEFLLLRDNKGSDTDRARDLFLSLWVSDLFMKQVEIKGDWYLMSADDCPGLNDVYGEEYELLYWSYVKEGKYRKKISALSLWEAVLTSQIQTGMPYIGYKDSINRKCNQNNLGTIKSSNLCHEITEYSDSNEYAVCNLASISLKACINLFNVNQEDKWTIYTIDNCKYCKYAKNYMNSLEIKFEENNIESKEDLDKLKGIIGNNKITFPQIFHNDKHVGGWSDLYKYTSATFDYDKLYDIAYTATINLNQIIDINYYPVKQAKLSNLKNRPIGLGIQGLNDALTLMKIPYDSEKALELNEIIMETIYLASMTASNDISKNRYHDLKLFIDNYEEKNDLPLFYDTTITINDEKINQLYHKLKLNKCELLKAYEFNNEKWIGAYSTFNTSLFAKGQFQFDLWNHKPHFEQKWNLLKESVKEYGTRNSLLTALMPTASTSQLLGNNECFEACTNNIYTRNTTAGDFIIVNKYLVNELVNIGIWSLDIKNLIIADDGSIQNIKEIPDEIKNIYKIIWEIKQVWVLKAALARSPFVDQAQSMNLFMAEPDKGRLTSSHFWSWKNGLKTGMYYLRSKPSAGPTKATIDPTLEKNIKKYVIEECENCSA